MSLLIPFIGDKCLASLNLRRLPLRLSALAIDTLMITGSSCGVKLQVSLFRLGDKGYNHWAYMYILVAYITILYYKIFFLHCLGHI